jgi:hypothetical protein
MSAIFTMAAKTRHKIWAVKIQLCPISSTLVPEICRGQVHVPKKERRRKRRRIITRIAIGGQSHMFRGSKGVGVTIESYGKLEILYINVDNF